MEVLKSQERLSCLYSACMKSFAIEVCNLELGIKKKLSPKKNKIIFILEGDLEFQYNDLPEKVRKKVTSSLYHPTVSSTSPHCTNASYSLYACRVEGSYVKAAMYNSYIIRQKTAMKIIMAMGI